MVSHLIGSMKVSKRTPFIQIAGFLEYIKDDSQKELKEQAEKEIGLCWDLTFREFFELSSGDFTCKGIDVTKPEELTALQFFWCERFRCFVDEFAASMERLTIPQSPEAAAAAKACMSVTFEESVVVFCREYFGLHNFADAYDISLGEFLIAKKDAYNKAVFEKKMAEIQEAKYKRK